LEVKRVRANQGVRSTAKAIEDRLGILLPQAFLVAVRPAFVAAIEEVEHVADVGVQTRRSRVELLHPTENGCLRVRAAVGEVDRGDVLGAHPPRLMPTCTPRKLVGAVDFTNGGSRGGSAPYPRVRRSASHVVASRPRPSC